MIIRTNAKSWNFLSINNRKGSRIFLKMESPARVGDVGWAFHLEYVPRALGAATGRISGVRQHVLLS